MILPVYDYAQTLAGEADFAEVTILEEPYLWTKTDALKTWRASGTIRQKKCFVYWVWTPEISDDDPHHILLDMREEWEG